jgi:hypothetical protein
MTLHDDLTRARAALVAAELAERPHERFLAAHAAALQVAACVLAVRARGVRTSRLGNVWELLAGTAPEFGEWAAFFAATQLKRQAVAAGATALVGTREADDLVRDASCFYDDVYRRLLRRRVEAGEPPITHVLAAAHRAGDLPPLDSGPYDPVRPHDSQGAAHSTRRILAGLSIDQRGRAG